MPRGTDSSRGPDSTDVDAVQGALRRERAGLAQARAALDAERAELLRQRAELDARKQRSPRRGGDPCEETWVVQGVGSFLSWAQDEDDERPRHGPGRDPEALDRVVEALSDKVAVRLEARVAQAVHEALLREREVLRDQREQLARTAASLERQRGQLEERWQALKLAESSRTLTETRLDLTPIELPPQPAPAPVSRPPSDRHKRPGPPS